MGAYKAIRRRHRRISTYPYVHYNEPPKIPGGRVEGRIVHLRKMQCTSARQLLADIPYANYIRKMAKTTIGNTDANTTHRGTYRGTSI